MLPKIITLVLALLPNVMQVGVIGNTKTSGGGGVTYTFVSKDVKNDCSGASCTISVTPSIHNAVLVQAFAGDQGGASFTSVACTGASCTCSTGGSFANRTISGYYTAYECMIYDAPASITAITATPNTAFDSFGKSVHVTIFSVSGGTPSFDDSADWNVTTATPSLSTSLTPSTASDVSTGMKYDNDGQDMYAGENGYTCTMDSGTYYQSCYKVLSSSSATAVDVDGEGAGSTLYISHTLYK